MRNTPSPKRSEPPPIADGLYLIYDMVGEDERIWGRVDEARLALQVDAAIQEMLKRAGGDREQLEFEARVRPGALQHLHRGPLSAAGLARLRRMARAFDLEVRIVLVPRPGRRRRRQKTRAAPPGELPDGAAKTGGGGARASRPALCVRNRRRPSSGSGPGPFRDLRRTSRCRSARA